VSPRAVTITSLQITDPAQVVAPARPAPDGLLIATVHDPALNHRLYVQIGADFRWTDRLPWSAEQWTAHAAGVRTRVATLGGAPAGYYELLPQGESVEVAIFGLLEPARGLGLGGHLLVDALTQGFALAPRVWLHTCTDDGPHALGNYRARGLRVFHVRPGR
jgi:GNAT superfamily N-acetyltransferase